MVKRLKMDSSGANNDRVLMATEEVAVITRLRVKLFIIMYTVLILVLVNQPKISPFTYQIPPSLHLFVRNCTHVIASQQSGDDMCKYIFTLLPKCLTIMNSN